MNLRLIISSICITFNLLFSIRGVCQQADPFVFIENKGQIKDQHGKLRYNIDFMLRGHDGMNIYIGKGRLEYQMMDSSKACRMDVLLQHAQGRASCIAEAPSSYYETYYTQGLDGIVAHSWKRISYSNIYPGIDWVLYTQGAQLEYEFVVHKGADASLISMEYNGASQLKQQKNGNLVAFTPMGTITEHSPIVYDGSGNIISSSYTLNKNVLIYTIGTSDGALVIDPSVEWATYYGAETGLTQIYDAVSGQPGSIYMGGRTFGTTSMATTGAYQTALNGIADGFLVRMDSSGKRIWASYFGGELGEIIYGLSSDAWGNVYATGHTNSTTGIATAGAQQTALSTGGTGGGDGFIVKFDSTGKRIWATYSGGSGGESFRKIVCDSWGNLYCTGNTSSPNNIATAGSFKDIYAFTSKDATDVFLLKYDSSGKKIWGTYYGGELGEDGLCIAATGKLVYIGGLTASNTGITTTGSFRPYLTKSATDSTDGFLVQFDSAGKRNWGTYYGGQYNDYFHSLACTPNGTVYALGNTNSDTGIASAGSWQPGYGGNFDLFLVKFDGSGTRQWATYYGGDKIDINSYLSRIGIQDNDLSDVYIAGTTSSNSGIVSPDAYQTSLHGTSADAFVAGFKANGNRFYGTYYGGNGNDDATGCIYEGKNLYLYGNTSSTSGIATPGSFKPTFAASGSTNIGFLVKFKEVFKSAIPVIANINLAQLKIFPNPGNGKYSLTGMCGINDGNLHLEVLNAAGKVLQTDTVKIIAGNINHAIQLFPTLPGGLYFVRLSNGQNLHTFKIVKE